MVWLEFRRITINNSSKKSAVPHFNHVSLKNLHRRQAHVSADICDQSRAGA